MADAYDLIAEARSRFGELSAAEEKLLRCAQSGDIAYCGPSENNDDPANDPAKADGWGRERTIRAKLIRWLCIDSEASKHIDPQGIQVHAASVGKPPDEKDLDLGDVDIPFPLRFVMCDFRMPLRLADAKIALLNLAGTRIPGLEADGLAVRGSVFLSDGFHASGEVRLLGAEIRGNLECDGGAFLSKDGKALSADQIKVAGSVFLRNKFSAEGDVRFVGAEIGGQINASAAQFGDTSCVNFENATVQQTFFWYGLGPDSPVRLNLSHASVGQIADDEQSWPRKGNLFLDGFAYERIASDPSSAQKRIEWLARQPDDFIPQPYRQLAKVLRERGDDAGARRVLIAMEDARLRFGGLSLMQCAASWVLWATVGYGYTPLRALWYIVSFVILGTILFGWGHTAGVVTLVEPKNPPVQVEPFNPFIYSLENFLPLVDLHIAKHWLPDPNAKPIALVWPLSESPSPTPASLGRCLRWYLWVHILLGWFFTSMFIAGITGLVRRE